MFQALRCALPLYLAGKKGIFGELTGKHYELQDQR